jgi:hypothetical protein
MASLATRAELLSLEWGRFGRPFTPLSSDGTTVVESGEWASRGVGVQDFYSATMSGHRKPRPWQAGSIRGNSYKRP